MAERWADSTVALTVVMMDDEMVVGLVVLKVHCWAAYLVVM